MALIDHQGGMEATNVIEWKRSWILIWIRDQDQDPGSIVDPGSRILDPAS